MCTKHHGLLTDAPFMQQVIYHLNNKNEDNELDLAELAEQYETEIEQILKDTADKINHFKAQLDAANDAARIAELTKVTKGPRVEQHGTGSRTGAPIYSTPRLSALTPWAAPPALNLCTCSNWRRSMTMSGDGV